MRRCCVLARWFAVLVLCVLPCLFSASAAERTTRVIESPNPDNAPEQRTKPYVVLVSVDGFRYDYARLYGARHLLEMAKRGASAPDGMVPVFPPVTFSNEYTLVTGLYPEHHGIVGERFYDPERRKQYSYKDPATVADGSWYRGVPLWSLAEQQGMRSACFFWLGSEAEIAGKRPSYLVRYDDAVPDEQRVSQVVAWLTLPEAKRPHFIALSFSEVDDAGARYGPDAPQTRAAVRHVDVTIGQLEERLSRLPMPVNLIVVSDHGMATVHDKSIDLDQYADFSGVESAGLLLYPPTEAKASEIYRKLRIVSDKFKVYRRSHVPADLHYARDPRVGDPVIVPTGPYAIQVHASADETANRGVHSADPRVLPEMRAIFFAEGPDIHPGVQLKPFESVNVYPWVAEIMGLSAPPSDGSAAILEPALVHPSQ